MVMRLALYVYCIVYTNRYRVPNQVYVLANEPESWKHPNPKIRKVQHQNVRRKFAKVFNQLDTSDQYLKRIINTSLCVNEKSSIYSELKCIGTADTV